MRYTNLRFTYITCLFTIDVLMKLTLTCKRIVGLSTDHDNSTTSSVERHTDNALNVDDSDAASRTGEQSKTKRAHDDDDLDDRQPPLGAQAQLGHDHRNTSHPVAFRAIIQHRVTAYVTWPAQLDCDVTSGSGVAGYIFRYRAVDGGSYVVRNLAVNFVLLDDLAPGMHYRYQVRYVPERGDASVWSQEGDLDTNVPVRQHANEP